MSADIFTNPPKHPITRSDVPGRGPSATRCPGSRSRSACRKAGPRVGEPSNAVSLLWRRAGRPRSWARRRVSLFQLNVALVVRAPIDELSGPSCPRKKIADRSAFPGGPPPTQPRRKVPRPICRNIRFFFPHFSSAEAARLIRLNTLPHQPDYPQGPPAEAPCFFCIGPRPPPLWQPRFCGLPSAIPLFWPPYQRERAGNISPRARIKRTRGWASSLNATLSNPLHHSGRHRHLCPFTRRLAGTSIGIGGRASR